MKLSYRPTLSKTVAILHSVLFVLIFSANLLGQTPDVKSWIAKNDLPPNVVMIAIDDLNDWVEPLGGHPQVKTPAMSALAARGLSFRNAHCQSPLCNSSRTSVFTSLRPSTTGVYGLAPWFRTLDEFKDVISLPQYFRNAGYETYSCGKTYHASLERRKLANGETEFDHFGPPGSPGLRPDEKLIPPTPAGNNPWVDWGVFPHEESDKGDYKVASWAEERLKTMPEDKPFFLATGFFLPHVPCHATQKWWDMYPDDTLIMPPMQPNDRDDCSPFSWYLHWNLPEPRLRWLEEKKEHRNLVRAYLASISFMDSQLQRVLDAVEASPYADNTIIVLWSDHGFHLGEKQISGKNTLWERSTRVPLIFAGPGIKPGVCDQPAELLDIYPTLVELTSQSQTAIAKSTKPLEGISLAPQMDDHNAQRRPAVTTHNPGNFGIRDERYRLIHYADESEELYDLKNDPGEFSNLIKDADHQAAADRLRKHVPTQFSPLAKGSLHRTLEQKSDGWYWEGELIDPESPPMKNK